jgi:hypothetical protein
MPELEARQPSSLISGQQIALQVLIIQRSQFEKNTQAK